MEKTYKPRSGFRNFCIVMGVICILFVVLIPFAILLFWLGTQARITITDEHLVIRWFGTRRVPWNDISSLHVVGTQGVEEAATGPISYTLKSKPNGAPRIALGSFEGREEILAEITRRTGLQVQA